MAEYPDEVHHEPHSKGWLLAKLLVRVFRLQSVDLTALLLTLGESEKGQTLQLILPLRRFYDIGYRYLHVQFQAAISH